MGRNPPHTRERHVNAQQTLAAVFVGAAALVSAILAWRREAEAAAWLLVITVGLVLWLAI
jgi:CHASE2 domain-containing sensor protein